MAKRVTRHEAEKPNRKRRVPDMTARTAAAG